LIGVIDEYTVDFRTKSFEVTVVKKSTEEYHKYLRYYLEKFYSTKRVDDTVSNLAERKGNSDIQRMLNFLVEFLYSEIADKRKQSISAMKDLCEIGLEHGNIEMKSYIHLYFNSKYARKDFTIELNDPEALSHYRVLPTKQIEGEDTVYNASLVDWSNEGVDANIDWFFDFTRIVVDDHSNAQMDNLKHLRGACTRLLIINPTNYTFRFLRAYSALVLGERIPPDKMSFKPILEDLDIGIQNFGKEQKDRKVFLREMNKIHQEIVGQIENQYNLEYIFNIDELFKKAIFLEHVRWTKQFENKLSTQLKKTRYERVNR